MYRAHTLCCELKPLFLICPPSQAACPSNLFQERNKHFTCGVVNFPEMVPMTASISQAYSSVSVSSDSPSWENMACPRTCKPERARWPSLRCSWSPSLCKAHRKHAPISIKDTAVARQTGQLWCSSYPSLYTQTKCTNQYQRYSSGGANWPPLWCSPYPSLYTQTKCTNQYQRYSSGRANWLVTTRTAAILFPLNTQCITGKLSLAIMQLDVDIHTVRLKTQSLKVTSVHR